jgi:hypothetical protein
MTGIFLSRINMPDKNKIDTLRESICCTGLKTEQLRRTYLERMRTVVGGALGLVQTVKRNFLQALTGVDSDRVVKSHHSFRKSYIAKNGWFELKLTDVMLRTNVPPSNLIHIMNAESVTPKESTLGASPIGDDWVGVDGVRTMCA